MSLPDGMISTPAGSTAWYPTPNEAAGFARQWGWHLFPGQHIGGLKTPRKGCLWKAESTAVPQEVIDLFELRAVPADPDKRSMICVHTQPSGLVVVDIDNPDEITGEWKEILDRAMASGTLIKPSVGRGLPHIYFLAPQLPDGLVVLDSAHGWGEIKADGYVAWSGADPLGGVIPLPLPDYLLAKCRTGPALISMPHLGPGAVRSHLWTDDVQEWVNQFQVEPTVPRPESFLDQQIERFHRHCSTGPRRTAARTSSVSIFIEAMAGCYWLEDGIEALRAAYREARDMTPYGEKGWTPKREHGYDQMWAGLIDHFDSDLPMRIGDVSTDLRAKIAEKQSELDIPEWTDETDDEYLSLVNEWRAWEGTKVAPQVRELLADWAERTGEADEVEEVVQPLEAPPLDSDMEPDTILQPQEATQEEPLERLFTELDIWAESSTTKTDRARRLNDVGDLKEYIQPLPIARQFELAQIFIHSSPAGKSDFLRELRRSARGPLYGKMRMEFARSGASEAEFVVDDEWDWTEDLIEGDAPDVLAMTNSKFLLYAGGLIHFFIGPKSSGKTTLAQKTARDLCREGYDVVWIDFEMGWTELKKQFLRLGMTRDERTRLHVIDEVENDHSIPSITELIKKRMPRPAFVFVDSMFHAIRRLGLPVEMSPENQSVAVGEIIDQLANPCRALTISTLFIDHTNKSDDTQGRGSGAKGDQSQVEYTFHVQRNWDRDHAGAVLLTCRKDRRGYHLKDRSAAIAQFTPDLSVLDEMKRPLEVEIFPPYDKAGWTYLPGEKVAELTAEALEWGEPVVTRSLDDTVVTALRTAGGIRLTSSQIASRIGSNRRTVERVIEDLVKKGVIDCAEENETAGGIQRGKFYGLTDGY